jgi:hypothetical protein
MVKGEDHASRRYGSRCRRKWLDKHFDDLLAGTSELWQRHDAVKQIVVKPIWNAA